MFLFSEWQSQVLSGPILRDTARLSQLLRAVGFLVSQHGQLGAIPPPPSLSVPPWRACEVEVRYPPVKRGISAIPARYPMKTRQMGAIPPSAILSRKGIARYGGVSRIGPLRSLCLYSSAEPQSPQKLDVPFSIEMQRQKSRPELSAPNPTI